MAAQVEAQKRSNRSALAHFEAFAGHREHLTALVKNAVLPGARQRLCVLGAGNCFDLDLADLSRLYGEIHLVDIDEAALERAYERQPPSVRARIACHGPVDLSGLVETLDRWRMGRVDPAELMNHPAKTCEAVASRLSGPFDVVLSSCLLTQLQWAALNVLSSTHPLFLAVCEILTLTHLRTLATLTTPGGRAILATDLATNQTCPLERIVLDRDPRDLLQELVETDQIIDIANPRKLSLTITIDPLLKRTVRASGPIDVWLWHNGPKDLFLVYAIELQRLMPEG